jgi:hypothetical protein
METASIAACGLLWVLWKAAAMAIAAIATTPMAVISIPALRRLNPNTATPARVSANGFIDPRRRAKCSPRIISIVLMTNRPNVR